MRGRGSRRGIPYVPEQIPHDAGNPVLLDALRREFSKIMDAFRASMDMEVQHAPPQKLYEGMLRYADGTDWNPGAGKGLYCYDGTTWNKL